MEKRIIAPIFAGFLALALSACGQNVQGASETSATDAETSTAETSAVADTSTSEAALPDAEASGPSATSSAVDTEASNQTAPAPSEDTTSEDANKDATETATNNQGKQGRTGGFGGGMGGGMDTQPGQTNEKGYTANDNGIAITATLNADEAFTERDLKQEASTADATSYSLASGKDINITEEGVYVISGTASEATIVVDAADNAKVQLVLDSVSISNTDFPAIYVKNADKVFVTLQGTNTLEVTGDFVADGETNTDAVIFSKDDLCLNGTGSLTINSTDHAIVSKDDLKVTGGTYTLNTANGSGLRANDSVRIAAGTFTINAEDGIKAKNDDDNELGYIYIKDGTFTINATDNGIQGYAFVWIDGGTFDITGEECIEGTYIQINDGTVNIDSTDDGINASIKSSVYTPTIEINGGTLTVNMASGDTDALDSNGYLYINGGTVNLNAQFPFDYAWGASLNGGDVYVNGEKVSEITESMMGGGFGGGMGGFGGRGKWDDQTPPDMQDGQTPPAMPDGQTPPDMGEAPKGMQPSTDGQTPPDWNNGERPQQPERTQQ